MHLAELLNGHHLSLRPTYKSAKSFLEAFLCENSVLTFDKSSPRLFDLLQLVQPIEVAGPEGFILHNERHCTRRNDSKKSGFGDTPPFYWLSL